MSSPPPASDGGAKPTEPWSSVSAAAAPAEQDDAAAPASSLQVPSSSSQFKKGHAPKPSVGIAASLFGSAADDDPFSRIAASNGSSSLGQLAEEERKSQISSALPVQATVTATTTMQMARRQLPTLSPLSLALNLHRHNQLSLLSLIQLQRKA